MQLSAAFGNLGRLAELERTIIPLSGEEKNESIRSFVETLEPDEFRELAPKISEDLIGRFFFLFRSQIQEVLASLQDPLQKGNMLFRIALSLPKKDHSALKDLLGEAITCARDALRQSKGKQYEKDARILLAKIFGSKGNTSGAIREISRFLGNETSDAAGYFELAKLYKLRNKKGDTDKAKDAFAEAIRLRPDFQQAYIELSRLHEADGNADLSIDLLKQLDDKSDTHPGVYNELGTLYKRKHEAIQDGISQLWDDIHALHQKLGEVPKFWERFFDLYKELLYRFEYPDGLPHERKPNEYLYDRRKQNQERVKYLQQQLEIMRRMPEFTDQNDLTVGLLQKYEAIFEIYQSFIHEGESNRYLSMYYYKKAADQEKPYAPALLNLGRMYLQLRRNHLAFRCHRLAIAAGLNVARYVLASIYLEPEFKNPTEAKKLICNHSYVIRSHPARSRYSHSRRRCNPY